MQITDVYVCEHCKQKTIRCTAEDGIIDEICPECGESIFKEPEPPTEADCWSGVPLSQE